MNRWWMVVEDDEVDRTAIERGLRQLGGDIGLAWNQDGSGVVEQLLAHSVCMGMPPDLVLLDLHLPRCGGHEVLALLKREPKTRCVPVLMQSTSDRPNDVARAFELGASGYFRKPLVSGPHGALRSIAAYWSQSLHAEPEPLRG